MKKNWSPDHSPRDSPSPKGNKTTRIVEFGKTKRQNETFAQADPTDLILDLRNQNISSPRQNTLKAKKPMKSYRENKERTPTKSPILYEMQE